MKKSNYNVLLIVALIVGLTTWGIYSTGERSADEIMADPVTWLIVVAAVSILISLIATYKALEAMKYMVMKKEGKLVEKAEEEVEQEDTWLDGVLQRLQDSRPIEEEADIDLDHEYDGIRELDNNLPPWWLYGFYISIVFAVIYLIRYHVAGTAPLSEGEYQEQMAQAEIQKAEYLKNAANLVDETSVVMLENQGRIKSGAAIFAKNCAVCHAQDGGGGVGPNLTDQYWLHGGAIKDVFSTVKYGVPAKGMVPWKDQLNAGQMQEVSSFIMTLQGTTPADPKEAQGDLYTPVIEDAVAPTDSVDVTDSTQTAELTSL